MSPSPSPAPEPSASVLESVLNKPAMTAPHPTLTNHVTKAEECEQTPHPPPIPVRTVMVSTQSVNCSPMSSTVQSGTTGIPTSTMVQLPLRIAMNNSQGQYTFARLPSGQQILLQSSSNSQPNLQGAQVLISKPSNSSNDQMAKAIIILQPQPGQGPSHTGTIKLVTTMGTVGSTSSTSTVMSANTTNSVITVNSSNPTKGIPPVSTMTTRHKALHSKQKSLEQLDLEIPYLCEWGGCGLRFHTHQQVRDWDSPTILELLTKSDIF